jgi:hypothetical protein
MNSNGRSKKGIPTMEKPRDKIIRMMLPARSLRFTASQKKIESKLVQTAHA